MGDNEAESKENKKFPFLMKLHHGYKVKDFMFSEIICFPHLDVIIGLGKQSLKIVQVKTGQILFEEEVLKKGFFYSSFDMCTRGKKRLLKLDDHHFASVNGNFLTIREVFIRTKKNIERNPSPLKRTGKGSEKKSNKMSITTDIQGTDGETTKTFHVKYIDELNLEHHGIDFPYASMVVNPFKGEIIFPIRGEKFLMYNWSQKSIVYDKKSPEKEEFRIDFYDIIFDYFSDMDEDIDVSNFDNRYLMLKSMKNVMAIVCKFASSDTQDFCGYKLILMDLKTAKVVKCNELTVIHEHSPSIMEEADYFLEMGSILTEGNQEIIYLSTSDKIFFWDIGFPLPEGKLDFYKTKEDEEQEKKEKEKQLAHNFIFCCDIAEHTSLKSTIHSPRGKEEGGSGNSSNIVGEEYNYTVFRAFSHRLFLLGDLFGYMKVCALTDELDFVELMRVRVHRNAFSEIEAFSAFQKDICEKEEPEPEQEVEEKGKSPKSRRKRNKRKKKTKIMFVSSAADESLKIWEIEDHLQAFSTSKVYTSSIDFAKAIRERQNRKKKQQEKPQEVDELDELFGGKEEGENQMKTPERPRFLSIDPSRGKGGRVVFPPMSPNPRAEQTEQEKIEE